MPLFYQNQKRDLLERETKTLIHQIQTYYDFRMINDFAMFTETEFIYSNPFINRRIIAANFTAKESVVELLDDIPLTSGFLYKNGIFYYVDYDNI